MKITVGQLKGLVREAVKRGHLRECGDTPCAPCAARQASQDPYGEDAFAYDMLMAGDEELFDDSPG